MEMIFVTAPFPIQLEHKARMEAARQRISRSELVRVAVADYLKRLEVQTTSTIPTKSEVTPNERQPA